MKTMKLLIVLAGLLFAPPLLAQSAPLRLELNIPTLRLQVLEGSTVVRSYPVAVGKPGHDTPDGSFTITHAEWNPWWRPPAREWARGEQVTPPGPSNPMGRVKLYFAPLYFIHGTPERASIGTPASHGCIRMLDRDVVELAKLLHERAGAGIGAKEIDRILARRTDTRRANFQTAVPFVIRYDPVVVEQGEVRVYPDVYRRGAIHAEGVYQALLAAGYDVATVRHEDVRRLVERARGVKKPMVVRVDEAFGDEVAATAGALASPS